MELVFEAAQVLGFGPYLDHLAARARELTGVVALEVLLLVVFPPRFGVFEGIVGLGLLFASIVDNEVHVHSSVYGPFPYVSLVSTLVSTV